MPSRLTVLFQLNTEPVSPALASIHVAGWSETHWINASILPNDDRILTLCRNRQRLLPSSAAIVGYRIGNYTISGKQLIANGAQTTRQRFPGSSNANTDVPQMALLCVGSAFGSQPNTSRFAIRGIPDSMVVGGEYAPTTAFSGNVLVYLGGLASSGFGFLGRVLSDTVFPITGITAGRISVQGTDASAPSVGQYLRFVRAFDDNDNPIKGSFLVTDVDVTGQIYTVRNPPIQTVTKPSGGIRQDRILVFGYGALSVSRVTTRKVGRPFENYRGRRSSPRA